MRAILNAKFCLLFVQIIILSIIFFTKFDNIAAHNDRNSSYDSQVNFINGFLAVSVAMVAVQLLLSLMGFPANKKLIPIGLILQLVGLFCYCCFILMKMHFRTIAFMWGVFSLLPFVVDVVGVISQAQVNKKYAMLDSK